VDDVGDRLNYMRAISSCVRITKRLTPRIRRSLYETKNKQIVNADINAALNIYKKYIIKSNSKDDKVNFLMSRGLTNPSRVIVAL
jgi:transposase